MPRRPLPFEQGHLDGLCGIYSIVNSIFWSLRNYPPLQRRKRGSKRFPTDAEFNDLFVVLLSNLVRGHSHLRPIVDGTNTLQLTRLLSKGSNWLTAHTGLALVVRQPFYGKRYVATVQVARTLGQHLDRPGTAVIVGVEAPLEHWTVVRRVSRRRLLLLDSAGETHLSMSEDWCHRTKGTVHPNSIFLVRLAKAARIQKPRA